MKRKILSLALTLTLVVLSLSSCGLLFGFGSRTVTYDFDGAAEDVVLEIDAGSLVPELSAPSRSGYKFIGWYTDSSYEESYDFNVPITKDLKLYALYVKSDGASGEITDVAEFINTVTTETIKAAVTLSVEKYDIVNDVWGMASKTNITSSSGSGVIFMEKDGYYYCLTNNHVVATDKDGYTVSVIDYKLSQYKAELVASDAEYDLAVVRFRKNYVAPLLVLPFEQTGLAVGETVIAIGTPDGQHNAVTVGEVTKYAVATVQGASETQSHVTFPVIWHSAPMNNGSSGGALISPSHKIVGINYAAASNDGRFVYGLTIPVSRVLEFLSDHGINV